MASLKQSLMELGTIGGMKRAAIVDLKSGMTMACTPDSAELEIEAAAHADLLKAKLRAQRVLGHIDCVQDILVTTAQRYHLIQVVPNAPEAMVYLEMDRRLANLALIRRLVGRVLEEMIV